MIVRIDLKSQLMLEESVQALAEYYGIGNTMNNSYDKDILNAFGSHSNNSTSTSSRIIVADTSKATKGISKAFSKVNVANCSGLYNPYKDAEEMLPIRKNKKSTDVFPRDSIMKTR